MRVSVPRMYATGKRNETDTTTNGQEDLERTREERDIRDLHFAPAMTKVKMRTSQRYSFRQFLLDIPEESSRYSLSNRQTLACLQINLRSTALRATVTIGVEGGTTAQTETARRTLDPTIRWRCCEKGRQSRKNTERAGIIIRWLQFNLIQQSVKLNYNDGENQANSRIVQYVKRIILDCNNY